MPSWIGEHSQTAFSFGLMLDRISRGLPASDARRFSLDAGPDDSEGRWSGASDCAYNMARRAS